jgi:hypothetical protein
MLFWMLWACVPPGPGDVGYVECEPYGLAELAQPDWTCETTEFCSRILARGPVREWFYRTEGGEEFCCEQSHDCATAESALVCTVCEGSQCSSIPEAPCEGSGGGDGDGGGGGGGTIFCNDGTRSPSCTTCDAGCCSSHGGCE